MAFVVSDDWQGHGLGSFMLGHLATIARRNGIRGFTAEVLMDNLPMQSVFLGSGLNVTRYPDSEVFVFQLDFT